LGAGPAQKKVEEFHGFKQRAADRVHARKDLIRIKMQARRISFSLLLPVWFVVCRNEIG
jgi:hypothetical protein